MAIKTLSSSKKEIDALLTDLRNQHNQSGVVAKMVLFFSSSNIDPQQIGRGVKDLFPQADVFGCTTSGEILDGRLLNDSLVAMVFDEDTIEAVSVQVVRGLGQGNDAKEAFDHFAQIFGISMLKMDINRYVGLVMMDGVSGAEERLMDDIGNRTNVSFVGGSAGDDLKFESTHVFANGEMYSDAAVLVLLKPKGKFATFKTQSFRELEPKLKATKVNSAERIVLEFDGKPAAEAYAHALDCSLDEAAQRFHLNPLGLMVGGEPYVRSPRQFLDGALQFHCRIEQGMTLSLLETHDIIEDTRADIQTQVQKIGGISALINFHCLFRTLELQHKGLTDTYHRAFGDIANIGFSTYGEAYLGHVNQTSTILAFE